MVSNDKWSKCGVGSNLAKIIQKYTDKMQIGLKSCIFNDGTSHFAQLGSCSPAALGSPKCLENSATELRVREVTKAILWKWAWGDQFCGTIFKTFLAPRDRRIRVGQRPTTAPLSFLHSSINWVKKNILTRLLTSAQHFKACVLE